jgi:hypothetical protein
MISITEQELCTVLCALRESAATATELGLMVPAGTSERAALLANAEVFSGLARRLEQRLSVAIDGRYASAAGESEFAGFTGLVCA